MPIKEGGKTPAKHSSIVFGGFIALFFLSVLNSSYSTVLDLIKAELALSYTMSGALMSSYFTGYALGQIPWGILSDRFGSRRVIAASISGTAAFTLVFSFASGFWQAIVARFLSGLLGAGVFVPVVKLVSDWFPANKRGTALGILSIGGSVGLIVSSWIAPFYSLQLGWRGALAVTGALGLASASVIWFTLRDKSIEKSDLGSLGEVAHLFRERSFWVMAFVQFVRLGANYAYIAWLPLLLREEYGLSLVAAGAIYSLFNLAGMISNPLGGIISDRVGEKGVLIASFISLSVVTYAFIGLESSALMHLLIIAMGWSVNFIRSPSFAILSKLYGVERIGRISGINNTFASAGAICLPFMLGYISDATASYHTGWALFSIILFSASILVIGLKTE